MFNGKNKAITFSYDDGITQDIRLIEIFNKYNLKATFNLNSELLGIESTVVCDGVCVEHRKNNPEDVKYIYEKHEVAVHTLTHPDLTTINEESRIIQQVEEDRMNLSELVGYEVCGMAYPGGRANKYVSDIIKNSTGIKYARTTSVTQSFEPCCDLFQYKGTLHHHRNWDILFEMGKQFLEHKAETPTVFYIWGHSYEFDVYLEKWEQFEEFCKMVSNKDDVFYGTNSDVLLLI